MRQDNTGKTKKASPKTGLDTSASSRGSTSEQNNRSYRSQGSNGSNTRRTSMTDEERGDAGKLKVLVKDMIMAKRLSDISQASKNTNNDIIDPASPDDPDLVAPQVVLDIWKIVADGAVDGTGK